MSQDPTIDPAFFQNQAMRGDLLGKAAVVLQHGLARRQVFRANAVSMLLRSEAGKPASTRSLRHSTCSRSGSGSLRAICPICLLRHLGGQDEDRVGQRDLLASSIVNEALAPGGHEGLDELGVGLVDILQIRTRRRDYPSPIAAESGPRFHWDEVQKYGPDLLRGWRPVHTVRRPS